MNYYHENVDAYRADKANIFLYQNPGDTLVLGEQCASLIRGKYAGKIKSRVLMAGAHDLPAEWQLQIPGEHNRYNAALALASARAADIPDAVTRAALESFPGVPGRLQLVRTVKGVTFYNDTNSTTPEATLVALEALRSEGESGSADAAESARIILIMGGADKGLNMEALLAETKRVAKRVVLLAGTGTERIRRELPDAQVYENLAMAMQDAYDHAEPGDAILFSPAFASFGMFTNEYDRGDRFDEIVKNLEA
jgi:UDP-N-acetylmuramoylalanine--D-glutamate ligase